MAVIDYVGILTLSLYRSLSYLNITHIENVFEFVAKM